MTLKHKWKSPERQQEDLLWLSETVSNQSELLLLLLMLLLLLHSPLYDRSVSPSA